MTDDIKDDDQDSVQERLDAASSLFTDCSNAWKDIRTKAEADLSFYSGQQWDETQLAAGQVKKEPTLSVNRLPQFVKQIENELRQREINITVDATDEESSEDTADIYNGLIRHIQADSKAHQHYIHAAGENGALVPGFGFLRVDVEPVSKRSWSDHKKIVITSIFDPFTVLPDFSAQSADFSDANYWFEISDYSIDEYRNEFPRSQIATLDVESVGAIQSNWGMSQAGEKTVRVLRYWYKETISYVKYLLEDGSEVDSLRYEKPVVDRQEADSEMTGMLPWPTGDDGSDKIISRERQVVQTKIKWMDLNGAEILREGDWAGEYFPFVAVIGPQTVVNGRRDIRGVIRYAKDSQKMLNYMASSVARRIGSANKAPWIADKRSIAPYQKQWQTANTENWSVLLYDAYRDNPAAPGELMQNPAPMRADQTGQINDLLAASAHWNDELKATIGIYDAGLGATPNEQSGIAIKTLAQQGANANLHFSENLVCSIEHLGCILIDLIPKVYDKPRVIKIVNPDSSVDVVKINQMFSEGGKPKKYDLSVGEYSVKVNAGPAYATRKQAALEQILELTRVDPQLTPVLQDLIVGAMDFEGSDIARDRLMKLFAVNFPQLQGREDQQVPPQAQAALAQQGKMIQQLTVELQALHQEYEKAMLMIKTDQVKMAGQIKLAEMNAQSDKELELLRTERDKQNNEMKAVLTEIKARLEHTEEMHKILMPHLTQASNIQGM